MVGDNEAGNMSLEDVLAKPSATATALARGGAGGKATLPVHPLLNLSQLDSFIAGGLPPGTPPNRRLLYSPIDDIHGALKYVLASAQRSIILAMYGFDDDELGDIIAEKLADENIYVQLTLDSSQAGGVHEKVLLAKENYPNSSVAIGRSERGAIMHLKTVVVDSCIVVHGSTNWSEGGETKQDNELQVLVDPSEAALVTTRISAIHTNMLSKAVPLTPASPQATGAP